MTDLPQTWAKTTLGAVAQWSSGGTPRSTVPEFYGGDIPWVVTGDLTDGPVGVTAQSLTALGLARSSAKLVPPRTVLVAMYGASIGRVGIADISLTTNQAIANAQVNEGLVTPKYVLYYLLGQRAALAAAGKGAAQPNIGQGILKSWPIPLAPPAEQLRIVAAIEEQFPRLDAGVAAIARAQLNLKRMRAAVLEAAVRAAVSAGAERVPLGDLVREGRKLAYGVLVPGGDIRDGIPLVRVGDLADRGINVDLLKRIAPTVAARFPRTLLAGGEVVISVVGTIGRIAVVPSELAGANVARALAVIPPRAGVDARYVAIALSRPTVTAQLSSLAHEVARKTLNLEDVRRYEIPMPSQETQHALADRVEAAEAWIAAIEQSLTSALQRSANLRSALLSAAFAGKLVEQNPTDEPALTLLERIAADRPSANGRRHTTVTPMKRPTEEPQHE